MKPSVLDEIEAKESSTLAVLAEKTRVCESPQNEVYLVLSCYSLQHNNVEEKERVNEEIEEAISLFGVDNIATRDINNGYITIGFPKAIFDNKRRTYFNFLYSTYKILKTESLCLTVNNNGNYIHKVFGKADFSFFEERCDNEEKLKHIEDVFQSLIQYANDVIDIKKEQEYFKYKSIQYYGGLVIRNIDCEEELQDGDMQYAYDIIEKLIRKSGVLLSVKSSSLYNMAFGPECNPKIPIILLKAKRSYDRDKRWDGVNKLYRPTGNMLGYYTREDEGFCKGPHIVLNADEIFNSAATPIFFKILLTKVLVHELAHAIMDKYLETQDKTSRSECWPHDTETLAMEESLANMITIQCFKEYDPDIILDVLEYIRSKQPAMYQFGIMQEKIGANWNKWRNSSKQNTDKLKEWFNNCFTNGRIISDLAYTKEMFDKVFD